MRDIKALAECGKAHLRECDELRLDEIMQIYEVAKNHSLTAMVAYALESAGVYDERFTQEKAKAIRKNAMLDI